MSQLKQRPSLMEKVKEFREVIGIKTLFFPKSTKEKGNKGVFHVWCTIHLCIKVDFSKKSSKKSLIFVKMN